jgi:DNA-binding GntR family transcriptional regulator
MKLNDGRALRTPRRRSPLQLPRVEARNLSDEVFGILRAGIMSQDLASGTRLFEVDVAERLGVSRAPVREALRRLEQEGLVSSFPRRGAIVVGLPENEIRAVYELRADIEAKAFAELAPRITPEQAAELAGILAGMERARVARDVEAVIAADTGFHSRVIEMAGYVLLRRLWSNIDGLIRLRTYQLMEPEPRTVDALIESTEYPHAVLLTSLVAGDPIEAAAAARAHILEVRELVDDLHARLDGAAAGIAPGAGE